MAVLKREDLSPEKWLEKLQRLQFPAEECVWMIVEKPWECRFEYFSLAAITKDTYRGRIFSASGEWKWRFVPQKGYRCVFLGEKDWSLLLQDDSSKLQKLQPQSRDIILWGEYDAPSQSWIEFKIPQYLQYPVSKPQKQGRVVITVEEWQEESGQVEFVRYKEVKNQTDKEKPCPKENNIGILIV